MKTLRSLALLTATLCCLISLSGCRNEIVRGGKATANIAVADSASLPAALLLQDFIGRITGAELEIVEGETTKGFLISTVDEGEIPEDGFEITTDGNVISIKGSGKGAVNGVVRILEDKMGVRYWAGNSVDFPKKKTLCLGKINVADAPAFRFRQTHSWSNSDPLYTMWYSLETPSEEFIDGLWVHTFGRIMPSSRFGKDHPEWYSVINGEHRPGNHSQWCLSNPELFEAVCTQLDSIFKANPGMDMISISQNDGNNTFCTCPDCLEVYEEEGAVSGAYIRFLNKLAERFPDKQFSTLAYLFTMKPPKVTKPLPNVNIMLCDIDCKREVPLTDNESGKVFVEALEGWSAISDNIFLWDYGINFDNIVSPFPNFHVLQPNIKLFRDNHVKMHFAQVNGILGGDFSELRAYMIEKLMWNPDADAEKLKKEFLDGYYGKAGKYLKKYLDRITEELLKSGKDLWIYDSPISHKDGCLSEPLRKEYNALFDKAEAAVASDSTHLARVRISRLTMQYSELEIARTEVGGDTEKLSADLDLFEARTAEYGIEMINERHNRPDDYCALYRERFLPGSGDNLALGATVTYNHKPTGRYAEMAPSVLADGLFGGTTYVESWVGWEGVDGEVVLDLGEEKEFTSIETDFLHQLGAWVLLPKGGTYYTSNDGARFTVFGSFSFPDDRDPKVKFVKGTVTSTSPVKARYIMLHVNSLGLCPAWHYGVGHPAWFFMDEIMVN